jgi:hydrogenase maturation protein HypF
LRSSGFQPYWHQRVPPNDGGISLGQIYAARAMNSGRHRVDNEFVKEGAE